MKLDRLSERIVRTLLRARKKQSDLWQLARDCGHISDVIRSVEQLARAGGVETKDSRVTLTQTRNLPAHVLKKEKPIEQVVRAYTKLRKNRQFANTAFDQLMITPEAVGHKLAVMYRRNDLAGRDVLCVGDDDLFSVACSLTGLPKSITVVDIDTELLAFIDSLSPTLPVPIRTLSLDLAKPLPKHYYSAFDVFITEPPETVKATLLFVKQGLNALRNGGAFYLGMTEVTLGASERHEIEKGIIESGAVFTDMLYNAEEYEVEGNELSAVWSDAMPSWITALPKEPWFVSTLFRGELVEKKKHLKLPRITKKDLKTAF